MGLNESIKADEEKLEALKKEVEKETKDEKINDEHGKPEEADAEQDGDGGEEKAEEKETKKEPVLDQPSNADFARMRRENAELRRQMEEGKKAKEPPKGNEDPEPNKEDVEEWLKWENRQIKKELSEVKNWTESERKTREQQENYNMAIKGFERLENEVKNELPEYEQVSNHLKSSIFTAIKLLNPRASEEQLITATRDKLLEMADNYASQGLNPAEQMYNLSKSVYGYKPPVKEPEEEEKGPDIEKINKNKQRSASPLNSGGRSGKARITPEAALNMTNAEFAKLPLEERQRLMGSRG